MCWLGLLPRVMGVAGVLADAGSGLARICGRRSGALFGESPVGEVARSSAALSWRWRRAGPGFPSGLWKWVWSGFVECGPLSAFPWSGKGRAGRHPAMASPPFVNWISESKAHPMEEQVPSVTRKEPDLIARWLSGAGAFEKPASAGRALVYWRRVNFSPCGAGTACSRPGQRPRRW